MFGLWIINSMNSCNIDIVRKFTILESCQIQYVHFRDMQESLRNCLGTFTDMRVILVSLVEQHFPVQTLHILSMSQYSNL